MRFSEINSSYQVRDKLVKSSSPFPDITSDPQEYLNTAREPAKKARTEFEGGQKEIGKQHMRLWDKRLG